jgi:hypothetical protein
MPDNKNTIEVERPASSMIQAPIALLAVLTVHETTLYSGRITWRILIGVPAEVGAHTNSAETITPNIIIGIITGRRPT